MHTDEQKVFLLGLTHQAHANERAARKIEGMKQFLFYEPVGGAFLP